jgi:Flp pilus assembly protein TadB
MAFRFRKSKSIFPGVRINLTPKGFGISAGTKGMRVSRSATGQSSLSAGIPGSGISYRKRIKKEKTKLSEHLEESPRSSNIVDSSLYIAKHGAVLTKKELIQSFIYFLIFIVSFSFWFYNLLGGSSSLVNVLLLPVLVFCFLYIRASSRNKKLWKVRTEEHLKNCNHSES